MRLMVLEVVFGRGEGSLGGQRGIAGDRLSIEEGGMGAYWREGGEGAGSYRGATRWGRFTSLHPRAAYWSFETWGGQVVIQFCG